MDRGMLGLVIRLSRLMGVAPYMRRAKDGVSKPLFISGVMLVTSVCSYILFLVMLNIINANDDKGKNMIIFNIFGIFGSCLLLTNAMIGVSTSSKRIAHMVRNLEKLDKIHEKICSYRSVLEDRKTHFLMQIYVSGIFAIYISDCFLTKSFSEYPVFESFMIIVRVWVVLCILQVILFSEKVLETTTIVNQTLHQLLIETNEEEEDMNNEMIKPKLAFVYSVRDIENNKKLRKNTCTRRNIADSVNGLLLVVTLLNHMLNLETTTYLIVLWMSCENTFAFEIVYLIYHDLFQVLGLFLLVDTFHRTHAELERTELLVRSLKYENDPPMAVNNELDLFQRILVLQKTSYSPMDMCTLDRSLLVKVFGMLISYLVIIITYGPKVDTTANKEL